MHSYRLVGQGASRYVVGDVKPYDQKNEMFKRPFRDPPMVDLSEGFITNQLSPASAATGTGYSRMSFTAGLLHDWVRWDITNTPRLNKLFLWGDDLFGYGRKGDSEGFWMLDARCWILDARCW
jgi:hypothetical protein